jgi:hypothetical protein
MAASGRAAAQALKLDPGNATIAKRVAYLEAMAGADPVVV